MPAFIGEQLRSILYRQRRTAGRAGPTTMSQPAMVSRDIDTIINALKKKHPRLLVRQLQVKHPGVDDDGIWFFNHSDSKFEVQLESLFGAFPFVVETDRHNERGQATTVSEAIHLVEDWLGIPTAS